jgi:hypothetical protein
MKYFVVFIFLAGCNSMFCQINDTLHIHIFGEFKNREKYQLKFEREVVCSFGGNDRIVEVDIPIDTNLLNAFDFLPMDIYKLNRFRNVYVLQFLNFLYYPRYDHILIIIYPIFPKNLWFIVFQISNIFMFLTI